jgi:hypothetical protein
VLLQTIHPVVVSRQTVPDAALRRGREEVRARGFRRAAVHPRFLPAEAAP